MKSNNATYTGFEFEAEGYPAVAIINTDLRDLNRAEYPYSVLISIVPDSYNEYGHPEGEEYDYLLDIEKIMIGYLEESTRTVHVGHTTLYRLREVIFYTKDREAVEQYLDNYLPAIERESSFQVEHDPEWVSVSDFYELL
jgi:hypothetical protein